MTYLLRFSFASVFTFLVACSSSSESALPPPASDPPATQTDPSDPPAGACNDIAHGASTAKLHLVETPEPTPTGGALSNGTFVLTEVTRYATTETDEREYLEQATMRVRDGVADLVVTRTVAGKTRETRTTSVVAVDGVTLTATRSCPDGAATQSFQYSITKDGFLLFGTFLGSRMVQHYVKAP